VITLASICSHESCCQALTIHSVAWINNNSVGIGATAGQLGNTVRAVGEGGIARHEESRPAWACAIGR
jgi:hypothetical protein